MRFVSWNVNGLLAVQNKGFVESFLRLNADCFCLQETKLQAGQLDLELPGYTSYWDYADRKGSSGTAVFTRHVPLRATRGIGAEEHNHEGRCVTLEFPYFYLVCVYTPNAQDELRRIDYRMAWEDAFRAYVQDLDRKKPVIICGDMNVAHEPIDLKHPKANEGHAGYSPQERGKFEELLAAGFLDTYRTVYPNRKDAYTWWSYRGNARANNVGWRIDYFLVSRRLRGNIREPWIFSEISGSDHCPVGLDLIW